jgi:hypothetical protein
MYYTVAIDHSTRLRVLWGVVEVLESVENDREKINERKRI